MPYSKPIPDSAVYKSTDTTAQVPVAFRNPTSSEVADAESIVQKIFDLIVLDN